LPLLFALLAGTLTGHCLSDMHKKAIYLQLKKRIQNYDGLSDDFIDLIEQNSEIVNIHKKKLLVVPGTLDNHMYFLAKGAFLMSIVTKTGETKTTSFCVDHYNDFVLCSDSYYMHTPTIYQVQAVEDSVLVRFNKNFIEGLIATNASFTKYALQELRNTSTMADQIRDARIALSSADFLQLLYEKYPYILERFPAHTIAGFMGISRVWLSNLKKRAVLIN